MWDGDLSPPSGELEVILANLLAMMVEKIDADRWRVVFYKKKLHSLLAIRRIIEAFLRILLYKYLGDRAEGGCR